jgi:hypothetical protein
MISKFEAVFCVGATAKRFVEKNQVSSSYTLHGLFSGEPEENLQEGKSQIAILLPLLCRKMKGFEKEKRRESF